MRLIHPFLKESQKDMIMKNPYKNAVLFLLLSLVFFLGVGRSYAERPIPKARGLVNDFADVIPGSHEQQIMALTTELLQMAASSARRRPK